MTRRRFTEREVVAIVARQVGTVYTSQPSPTEALKSIRSMIICPICNHAIMPDQIPQIERDHDDAVGFGEGRDTPENCRFVHGHCHKRKTAKDKARMAKADRQGGKTGQRARRERNGPTMQSRGFDKRFRKKFDGTVERRAEGDET